MAKQIRGLFSKGKIESLQKTDLKEVIIFKHVWFRASSHQHPSSRYVVVGQQTVQAFHSSALLPRLSALDQVLMTVLIASKAWNRRQALRLSKKL